MSILKVAKLLVEHGAMVNKGRMDSYGCTPLYTASFSGFTEIVRILLQHGADPNIPRSDDGSTPLYLASGKFYCQLSSMICSYIYDK